MPLPGLVKDQRFSCMERARQVSVLKFRQIFERAPPPGRKRGVWRLAAVMARLESGGGRRGLGGENVVVKLRKSAERRK